MADNQRDKFIVGSPNPSLRNISRTYYVKIERKNCKRDEERVGAEDIAIHYKFFGQKKLIEDKENQGMSRINFNANSRNEEMIRLDSQNKPETAVKPKF